MKGFKNLLGSLHKRYRKAQQWALMQARRGHRSQSEYAYQSDLESGYACDVEFPILRYFGESYSGLTPEENASAVMTNDDIRPSPTTSQPDQDNILTADAISDLAEALRTDITRTINNYAATHSPDPAEPTVDSLSNTADAITSEAISVVGDVMKPGSVSLKRPQHLNETDTVEDPGHKRPRIDFELSVSFGAGQSSQEARNLGNKSHDDIHTVININSSSPAHATPTHFNCGKYKAPSISISIDHNTTRPLEIISLDQNSLSTPATATPHEPIPDTNKAIESGSKSLKRARVEVLDQKIEVTVSPVPKRQRVDSADHPVILGPPSTPGFVERSNVPMTPVRNHQDINSSGDSMIGTPCSSDLVGQPNVTMTPVINSSGDSMIGTPRSPDLAGQPDVPVTPGDNLPETDFSDDAMILDPPLTPVYVKDPKEMFTALDISCNCKDQIDDFMKEIFENVESVAKGDKHFHSCFLMRTDQRRRSM